jgi:hypothetical protein
MWFGLPSKQVEKWGRWDFDITAPEDFPTTFWGKFKRTSPSPEM